MKRYWLTVGRAGLLLLALALCAMQLPGAAAMTNGQPANLVLGQPDFTSNGSGTSQTQFNSPSGIAVDPLSGKVFVADQENNRVLRFASGAALVNGAAAEGVLGQSDFTSSSPTRTRQGMDWPSGLVVDSGGRLWVTDYRNSRVLRFENAASKPNGAPADGVLGQPDFTTGVWATTSQGMRGPIDVAVDSGGRLWVADFANNRVLRFDSAASKPNGAAADGVLGQSSFTTNSPATSATGMAEPSGVSVDSAGRLWVAEFGNDRILRFDNAASKPNGAPANGVLGQSSFTTKSVATTATSMWNPWDVAVDSIGRLWVTDSNNFRVLRFDEAASKPNGAPADGVLGQNDFTSRVEVTTASTVRRPQSVAVDNGGSLWVVDDRDNRALRFNVRLAPPITWLNPAPISYGTPLSAAQLNAITNVPVPGSFSYTPGPGTVLNAGTGQTLTARFTPTDSMYVPVTVNVTIDVTPATQTITFGALADKNLGDAPFTLSGSASSGLPLAFTSTTPAVCSVGGNTVTLQTGGTCTIVASQPGDANHQAAPPVSQSFRVQGGTDARVFLPLVTR
ncbi:MAG: NHL repeat-containing protein [Chloroflexaceae bacterium]|nr:NHL repeat-containing protein [Chloroflexaceae bacterium]